MARKEGSARVLGLSGRPESCLCQDPVFGKTEFIERIGGGDIPHGGLIFGGKILGPSASGRSEQSFFACVCEQADIRNPSFKDDYQHDRCSLEAYQVMQNPD